MADIKFNLEIDDSNFSRGIERAIGDINKMSREMGATSAEIKQAFNKLGAESFKIGGDKAVQYFTEEVRGAAKVVDDLEVELANLQNTEGFDKNSDEAKKLKDAIGEANGELEKTKAALSGAQNAQAASLKQSTDSMTAMKDVVSSLPGPMGGAVSGLKKLVTAAKAFIATPLGAVVAALVAVFSTLKSYFTGTAEGQQKLAKVTAYLGSLFSSLKDVASKIGGALVNAFSNPKEAIKSLADMMKRELMARVTGVVSGFKAMGKIIKSVVTLDWEGLKEGAQDYANAVAQVGTGRTIEELGEGAKKAAQGVKEFAKNAEETATKMAALKEREIALRKQRSEWQIKEAQLEEKISEARLKAYDEDSTKADAAEALAKMQELITEKYEKQIAMAREAYEIRKKENSLHDSTIEDLEAENELQANITRLEAQRNSELAGVERRRATQSKGAKQQEFALLQEEKQLEIQVGEARLKMQDESLKKTMEQIELDRQKQQIELKTQENSWRVAQGGELTKAQEDYIASMVGLIDEAAATSAQAAIFDKYADAAAKAIKQNKAFEKDIELLKGQNIDTKEVERQRDNAALEYMQSIEGGLTSEFQAWIDSLVNYTTNQLESMLQGAEAQLLMLKANGASEAEILAAEAKIAKLRQEVKAAQVDIQRGPKLAAYRNLNQILSDGAEGFAALGESGNEAFDAIMKDVSSVLGSVQAVVANIQNLVQSSIAAEQKAAQEGATAVKTVEKASVILAIIGVALQLAMKIKSMFDNSSDHTDELRKSIQGLSADLRQLKRDMAIDTSVNNTIFGDNAYKNVAQYRDAVKQYSEAYAEAIKNAQLYADQTTDTTGPFGKVSKMYSAGQFADMLEGVFGDVEARQLFLAKMSGSIDDLANSIENYQVKTKHGTWFRDAEFKSIKELAGGLELVGETTEETMANLKTLAKSEYFGKLSPELQSAINEMIADWDTYEAAVKGINDQMTNWFGNWTSTIKDAIKTGFTDGVSEGKKSFSQGVAEMLDDFYLDMVIGGGAIGQILEEAGAKISDMIVKGASADQIADAMVDVKNQIDPLYEKGLEGYKNYKERMAENGLEATDSLNGTLSGAIKGASQESIDLLSGYCNAVRVQQVDSINIMREQLISLSGIESNTRSIDSNIVAFRSAMEQLLTTDGARAIGA